MRTHERCSRMVMTNVCKIICQKIHKEWIKRESFYLTFGLILSRGKKATTKKPEPKQSWVTNEKRENYGIRTHFLSLNKNSLGAVLINCRQRMSNALRLTAMVRVTRTNNVYYTFIYTKTHTHISIRTVLTPSPANSLWCGHKKSAKNTSEKSSIKKATATKTSRK